VSPAEELTLWSGLARDHGARCTLVDPESRDWQDRANAALEELAAGGGTFTASDLRRQVGDPTNSACVGAVFLRASPARRIRCIGVQTSSRIQHHAGLERIWEGSAMTPGESESPGWAPGPTLDLHHHRLQVSIADTDVLTAEEAEALERLTVALPGSTIGPTIPNGEPPKALLEEADEILAEPEGVELVPLDFAKLLGEGIPELDTLHMYVVRGTRIWAFGPAESTKTLFFQWLAAKLTREGRTVAFVSAENPLATDLDRMTRLHPDFSRLRYYHMPILDLAEQEHFVVLARACAGADLVVIDTMSAVWSGDENDNRAIVGLDRDVLAPLVKLTQAAVVLIHHTGHPQAFVNRGGVAAGRGASAMGQKADCVLVFSAVGSHEFTIDHAKNRTPGGHKEPRVRFKVVDTDDGGLDIEVIGKAHIRPGGRMHGRGGRADFRIRSRSWPEPARTALYEMGFGGSTADRAFVELREEDPPRVQQVDGMISGADGKQRKGRPWMAIPN